MFHICLAAALVASWSLTQVGALLMTNIFCDNSVKTFRKNCSVLFHLVDDALILRLTRLVVGRGNNLCGAGSGDASGPGRGPPRVIRSG